MQIALVFKKQIFRMEVLQKRFLYYLEVPKLSLHSHFLHHMNKFLKPSLAAGNKNALPAVLLGFAFSLFSIHLLVYFTVLELI